jgi:hypothetical protein
MATGAVHLIDDQMGLGQPRIRCAKKFYETLSRPMEWITYRPIAGVHIDSPRLRCRYRFTKAKAAQR